MVVLASMRGEGGQNGAFYLAYLVSLAVILFNAYRAAAGDDKQILAGPVTAVLVLAVFDSFGVQDGPLQSNLCLLLMAVAFGTSVLAILASGWSRLAIFLAGPIVGLVGLLLTTTAINHHLPGSGLYIAFDDIPKIDPLHLDYLRGRTDAELREMHLHNAAAGSGVSTWKIGLFALQTVALAGWDALILSLGVWITGLAVTSLAGLFTKKGA
jgi:hypothetical protein